MKNVLKVNLFFVVIASFSGLYGAEFTVYNETGHQLKVWLKHDGVWDKKNSPWVIKGGKRTLKPAYGIQGARGAYFARETENIPPEKRSISDKYYWAVDYKSGEYGRNIWLFGTGSIHFYKSDFKEIRRQFVGANN
ncbi:hypothetical protein KAW80_02125 [Candidatus Babeliales bacterium]|nr:hypothetical protein [Candidatus Babeliales bacterium]